MRLQAIIEKLISHRFFRRKQGLPRMAKHMEQQRHRILYAEDILRLNADSRATTSDDDADAGSGGKAGAAASPQMLAVALQNGPRGPEVSNLQTDSAELFYAVHMHMHVHMHMQVTGVDLEDKAELLKLCKQLGGTVANKNADAATVTHIP